MSSCEREILAFKGGHLSGKWKLVRTVENGCYHHCTIRFTSTTYPGMGNDRFIDFKTRGIMYMYMNDSLYFREKINLSNKEATKDNGEFSHFSFSAITSGSSAYSEFNGDVYSGGDSLVIRLHPAGSSSSYQQFYILVE